MRRNLAIALLLLGTACVDSAGPGGEQFGQVRVRAVFNSGEAPSDLRLDVRDLRVVITRVNGAGLVDTVQLFTADATLGWLLPLTTDEEQLSVHLELSDVTGMLYDGDDAITARAGLLGDVPVRDVTVSYIGPPRAMSMAVTPGADTLTAIGAVTALHAAAYDGAGIPLPSPVFVWESSDPNVATVDQNGMVTATGEGITNVWASLDGLADTSSIVVTTIVSHTSSVIIADPNIVVADGSSAATLTVHLFDANGAALGRSAGTVMLASTLGSLTPVIDHDDGTYSAWLTSLTAGSATVTGTLDGVDLQNAAIVTFTPGHVAPGNITITAAPTTIVADGLEESIVTVQLVDAHGNAVGTSGGTVLLNTTLGSLTPTIDHGDGTYTATLTSTTTGTARITGTMNGAPIADQATVDITPGVPAPNTATIDAAPGTIIADGTDAAVVTVRLYDSNNNPITVGGGIVTLGTTLGTLTAVVDQGDGTYSASLTSTSPGPARMTGTLNGVAIIDDATVEVVPGNPTPNTATIDAVPDTIIANGIDASVITVRLHDGNGHPLTISGGLVTLTTTLGNLTGVTDHNDGTYTATLTGVTTGSAVITGTLNGVAIVDDATVDVVPGNPTPNTATIDAVPDTIIADGVNASVITVRLHDGNGHPLTTSGGLVTLTTTLGNLTGVTDHNDGTYTARLTGAITGSAVITGTLNGSAIADDSSVEFVAGPPTPHTATIDAVPDTIIADGVDASVITVRLHDGNGHPLTTSGGLVTLTTTLGNLTGVTDHNDGTYTATLTGVTTGSAVITGTLNGSAIADDSSVEFVAGPPTPHTATIDAVPDTIIADGIDASVITVRLYDGNGHPVVVSGGIVALSTTLGNLTAVVDHGDGTYSASLTSGSSANAVGPDLGVFDPLFGSAPSPTGGSVGIAVITGTLNGVPITDDATVVMVAGPASPTTSTIIAVPDDLPAQVGATGTIIVQLLDAGGNPLSQSGGIVTLTTTLGSIGPVTDNGDGSYVATFTASDVPGIAVITGTLNGVSMSDTAQIVLQPI